MVRVRHRWLRPGEHVRWHAMANRGDEVSRQVAGTLYVTDQRLVHVPNAAERFTQETTWEAPIGEVRVQLGPGLWEPRLRLLRPVALRFRVRALRRDGRAEDFFVPHLGEPLEQLAA